MPLLTTLLQYCRIAMRLFPPLDMRFLTSFFGFNLAEGRPHAAPCMCLPYQAASLASIVIDQLSLLSFCSKALSLSGTHPHTHQ